MKIAELKAFRKRYHLTQEALAKILRVHTHTVYMWESGRRRIPDIVKTVESLMKLVDTLTPPNTTK